MPVSETSSRSQRCFRVWAGSITMRRLRVISVCRWNSAFRQLVFGLGRCCRKRPAVIGFAIGARFGLPSWASSLIGEHHDHLPGLYAIEAHTALIGWGPRRSAIVLRFCTMAGRWSSSRAPMRPRRRMRSKPRWTFRCAKRIYFLARIAQSLELRPAPLVTGHGSVYLR